MKFEKFFLALGLVLAVSLSSVQCWDNREMQMFDLVEELKEQNFYEFLDIYRNATSGEVRRAYRRKSLRYHPDKNSGDAAAEAIFRQLVGVYEILKDAKLRERYNDVLDNGLPTWRQPVFYYRQLRKMGLMETGLLVFTILTIGHYFVLWGSYLERKLNMEDYLSNVYKKSKARKKQKDFDNVIQEELSTLPRPRIRDVWPIALTVGTFRFIRDFPSLCKETVNEVRMEINKWLLEREKKKKEEEELKEMKENEKRQKELKKKRKAENAARMRQDRETNAALVKDQPVAYNRVSFDLPNPQEGMELKTGDWTDEDWILLTRAIRQYRQGVPERWQRIAEKVGRSIEEVTTKAKEMQDRRDMPMTASVQHSVSGLDSDVLSGRVGGGITMRDSAFVVVENAVCGTSSEEEEEYESAKQRRQARRRKKRQTDRRPELEENGVDQTFENTDDTKIENQTIPEDKTNTSSFPEAVYSWSQNEQTALETAIRKFPKGTHDRWDRIADCVGNRSKAECMDRVRYLTEKVKSKSK